MHVCLCMCMCMCMRMCVCMCMCMCITVCSHGLVKSLLPSKVEQSPWKQEIIAKRNIVGKFMIR